MRKDLAKFSLVELTLLVLCNHFETKLLGLDVEVVLFLIFDLTVKETLPNEVCDQTACQNGKGDQRQYVGVVVRNDIFIEVA